MMGGDASQGMDTRMGEEELMTQMWLDDALTDLAAVGLDMPFL